jgi:hypothetical protein
MNTHLNYALPSNQYVSREYFSSCSKVSQEEFLLRRRPLFETFSLETSALRTYFGSTTPKPPPKK